ncbi:MAG: alpha 1,2 mannosyltransferase [Cirrosporium novae-zelandiae]|nr:MAG: alpha 1,2 mannosyltransferase [Cirrosporium novae-zelandiae]
MRIFRVPKPSLANVFPLWPVYGLPMLLLRWVWTETGNETVAPRITYYTLRVLMFALSFVLEDWAIHELVRSPRHRREAVVLVASSYVTWTYQTHTFSNSIETLLVAWSLVLIQRILENRNRSSFFSSSILAFLLVFGIFNRITFPTFVLIPCLRLLPHFIRKPGSFLILLLVGSFIALLAIFIDTNFYNPDLPILHTFLHNPTITPLNSLLYNTQTSNLAQHGLHPRHQHILINLPQLLGPALLLLTNPLAAKPLTSLPILSSISSLIFLSILPHQELRFLIPIAPLVLSTLRLPVASRPRRLFFAIWLLFNAIFGVLMGSFHQAGVVPAQLAISEDPTLTLTKTPAPANITSAFWWKTYSPPIWLLNGKAPFLETHDLMGLPGPELITLLTNETRCSEGKSVLLIAPRSAKFLDRYTTAPPKSREGESGGPIIFTEVWSRTRHLNLDGLDFGEDGVWETLKRVVGRAGIVIWRVGRDCNNGGYDK